MKKIVFVFLLVLSSLISSAQQPLPDWVLTMQNPNPDYRLLKQQFETYWSDKRVEVAEDDKKFEEDEFSIKEEYGWLRFYIRQYKEMITVRPVRSSTYRPDQQKLSTTTVQSGEWKVAGPKKAIQYMGFPGLPIGVGRVNHLAFSGINPNVLYAAAPAGLFISTDTGATWNSTITDFMGFHQFRTVAVDPTNDSIIYVGCGDFYSIAPFDAGVIKSTDFGATFTSLSNGMDTTLINVIEINPLNTSHLVAGGYKGIWTTFDAGSSWQQTLPVPTTNMVYDIKFKPGSMDTLYAVTANTFYMSTDGGLNWTPGFNNFQFTDISYEQLLLAVTPAAPEYVYIVSQQDFGNIYRSTDGGNTFTAMKKYTAPGLVGYDTNLNSFGQGAYDFAFSADPVDPDKLYIGSISVYESHDGGASWITPYSNWAQSSMNNGLHADQHFIAKNILLPDRVFSANDGGVYMKMDSDTMFVPRMNNLCVTQAYHFDADNFYDSTFAVGTQDNGGYFTNNGNDFYFYRGGDMFGRVYCAYNNNAAIYTWGVNFSSGANNIDIHTGSGSYPLAIPETAVNEPISLTPVMPLTGFVANMDIWETNDLNGNPVSWRVIFDSQANTEFIAANHCLADSNIFYAVRADGWLFRTFDALVNQPTFDSVPIPVAITNIPSITTVPNDPNVLFMCGNAVYKSNDKGLTWTNITGPMNPIYGFQEIVADPFATDGSVYVIATNKIYYSNDTTGWIDYSFQLPDVTYINDITVKKFNSQVRKVMVTLLNRSIWESPVMQTLGTGIVENEVPDITINVYPVPATDHVIIAVPEGESLIQKVIVYDEHGRQVGATREAINKRELRLETQKLISGMYILEIVTARGSVMKKITVLSSGK